MAYEHRPGVALNALKEHKKSITDSAPTPTPPKKKTDKHILLISISYFEFKVLVI